MGTWVLINAHWYKQAVAFSSESGPAGTDGIADIRLPIVIPACAGMTMGR